MNRGPAGAIDGAVYAAPAGFARRHEHHEFRLARLLLRARGAGIVVDGSPFAGGQCAPSPQPLSAGVHSASRVDRQKRRMSDADRRVTPDGPALSAEHNDLCGSEYRRARPSYERLYPQSAIGLGRNQFSFGPRLGVARHGKQCAKMQSWGTAFNSLLPWATWISGGLANQSIHEPRDDIAKRLKTNVTHTAPRIVAFTACLAGSVRVGCETTNRVVPTAIEGMRGAEGTCSRIHGEVVQ